MVVGVGGETLLGTGVPTYFGDSNAASIFLLVIIFKINIIEVHKAKKKK